MGIILVFCILLLYPFYCESQEEAFDNESIECNDTSCEYPRCIRNYGELQSCILNNRTLLDELSETVLPYNYHAFAMVQLKDFSLD